MGQGEELKSKVKCEAWQQVRRKGPAATNNKHLHAPQSMQKDSWKGNEDATCVCLCVSVIVCGRGERDGKL